MSTNYQKCYSVLGVFHDDNWETVRAAYKRQIRRWHPDKFQDPDQKSIAELKSKEVNQAFRLLDDYYRENGSLPSDVPENGSSQNATNPSASPLFDSTTPLGHIADSASSSSTYTHSKPPRRGSVKVFLILAVIIATYLTFESHLSNEMLGHQTETPVFPRSELSTGQYRTRSQTGAPHLEGSDGAIPDQTGTEQENGTVSTFNSGHTHHRSGADNTITIGSTQKEVLTIQGRPFRQTEASWEYGLSRIDFRNGKVVGWYESPMNPLRVAR
jgi:DnaJ domain